MSPVVAAESVTRAVYNIYREFSVLT